VLDESSGAVKQVKAKAVVLATGGAGQIYARTTNPPVATGGGVAMAYRAGAMVEDMEFVQFHPTALCLPATPQFLLTEARRRERGGWSGGGEDGCTRGHERARTGRRWRSSRQGGPRREPPSQQFVTGRVGLRRPRGRGGWRVRQSPPPRARGLWSAGRGGRRGGERSRGAPGHGEAVQLVAALDVGEGWHHPEQAGAALRARATGEMGGAARRPLRDAPRVGGPEHGHRGPSGRDGGAATRAQPGG